MMETDDQYKATIDEVRLYRAARAMISGFIGKWSEIDVVEVTRCKAVLIDVLVALGAALYVFDGRDEFFNLFRGHCNVCGFLLIIGGDRTCQHGHLADKTFDGSAKPFGDDGRVSIIASEAKSVVHICAWGVLVKSG